MLNVNVYNSGTAFVRPDDPALYAKAVNVQSADVTVAPLTLQEYLLMQNSYENQQAFNPDTSMVYPHTFNLPPSKARNRRNGARRDNFCPNTTEAKRYGT